MSIKYEDNYFLKLMFFIACFIIGWLIGEIK